MKTSAAAALLAFTAAVSAAPIPVAMPPRTEPVEFARDVYPMLKKNCLACHNTTKAKANLNLESPADMLKGGDGGAALVPGRSTESLLFKAAAHLDDDSVTAKVRAAATGAGFQELRPVIEVRGKCADCG